MAMFTPGNHHIPQNNQLTEQVSLGFVAENAVLLTWPEVIDPNQHQQIIQVEQAIKQHFTCALLETIVSYNSLILYYQFQKVTQVQLIEQLTELLNSTQPSTLTSTSKVVEIPVYYGEDAGWDLTAIAAEKKLTTDEVIHLHSARRYRAYALGFTPGFCYLASLAPPLVMPRKARPRIKVPAGAVAIAEQQTAVYPSASPGGWHILGQTPQAMFSITNGNFTPMISVGDTVVFKPIDKTTFKQLGGNVDHE